MEKLFFVAGDVELSNFVFDFQSVIEIHDFAVYYLMLKTDKYIRCS